jgi:hypothetical protein
MKDTVATFVKEFALAVPQAVVITCKAEAKAAATPDTGYLLDQAGSAAMPLKMGRLVKSNPDPEKGTWQERFFVLYNAADNFKVRKHCQSTSLHSAALGRRFLSGIGILSILSLRTESRPSVPVVELFAC